MIGSPAPSLAWLSGDARLSLADPKQLAAICQAALAQTQAEVWLFWDADLGEPPLSVINRLLQTPYDLWHAGLRLGTAGKPGLMDFVSPTTMWNRDPDAMQPAASWRISLRACLVRVDVLREIGFIDPDFETLDGAGLEWGYRCMTHGVLCRHDPALVSSSRLVETQIQEGDELRFVRRRFGLRWARWAVIRAVVSGYWNTIQAYQAWRKVKKSFTSLSDRIYSGSHAHATGSIPSGSRVSVLIPTLERYPYLEKVIAQLRQQIIPAHEILIVDQTPAADRVEGFYARFNDLPLRVFYQEQPGQCSSRNAGLLAAVGDFILFLDDDDEIPADLIENHMKNIARFEADGSCGVAHEVGAGALPESFTYLRTSDVFPTNNSMLRRAALYRSGLFDLAYNHGARADADLGMRLYLNGVHLIIAPSITVLHHHAPRGGLRVHQARKITYAGSRHSLLQRHIPGSTEFYYAQRYFSPRQVREMKWISLFATLSLHGPSHKRVVKFLLGCFLLPESWLRIQRSQREANNLLREHPTIPTLAVHQE